MSTTPTGVRSYVARDGAGSYGVVRLVVEGAALAGCDMAEVGLWRSSEVVERVRVGAPPDGATAPIASTA